MQIKLRLAAAGAAAVLLSTVAMSTAARAQSAVEAELVGYHQLCEKGDRRACIRFGMVLEKSRIEHARWRQAHAEWFWWER